LSDRRTSPIPPVYYDSLLNGLQVLIIERSGESMATLSLMFKSGASFDLVRKSGTAAMTTRAMALGAEELSGKTIASRLQALGARMSTSTTWDSTTITIEAPSRRLAEVITITAHFISRPTFDEAELLRLKEEYAAELQARQTDPSLMATQEFYKSLYGPHPYSRPAAGTVEDLANITRIDLVRHHARFFIANHATLVIVSDISPSVLMPLVRAYFGGMLKGKIVPPTFVPPTPVEGVSIKIVDRSDLGQAQIRLGSFALERFNEDYFPALVLARALNALRLPQLVREQDQGEKITCEFELRSYRAPFVISASVQGHRVAQLISNILQIVNEIRTEGITAQELDTAKQQVIENYLSQAQTARQIAEQLHLIELYGLGRDYPQKLSDRINQVTLADVQRVAEKYLPRQNLIITVVGRAEDFAEDLKKIGKVEIVPAKHL